MCLRCMTPGVINLLHLLTVGLASMAVVTLAPATGNTTKHQASLEENLLAWAEQESNIDFMGAKSTFTCTQALNLGSFDNAQGNLTYLRDGLIADEQGIRERFAPQGTCLVVVSLEESIRQ